VQWDELIESTAGLLNAADKIFIIACGTSFHAALLGGYFFAKVANIPATAVLASEFPNFLTLVSKKSIVIAISQSGETADVLSAVKLAKKAGARVISIVNVVGSSLARQSDLNIMMNAGPEICVLATKSYIAQLSLLYLIANAVVKRTEQAKQELTKEASLIESIIKNNNVKAKKLALRFKDITNIFVIGKNENAVTALESALKIKEVSYIHAEGFPSAELKHGPIALIEKGVPVIVLCSNMNDESINNAIEAKARGAKIIGIAPEKHECFDYFMRVPNSRLFSMLSIIPVQLFAYHLAVARNLDPDKPRNLAKSVTVK